MKEMKVDTLHPNPPSWHCWHEKLYLGDYVFRYCHLCAHLSTKEGQRP